MSDVNLPGPTLPGPTRPFRLRLLAGCAGIVAAIVAASCDTEPRMRAGWPSALGPVPRTAQLQKPARNEGCLVCHMDFGKEKITARHAKAGVGCVTCHGRSSAHGGDEANIIKPDVIFGRAEIDAFCKNCHSAHSRGSDYQAFLKTWADKRHNGRIVSAESVCTDCHGNHAVLRLDQLE